MHTAFYPEDMPQLLFLYKLSYDQEIINPDSLKVLPNCYIEKFAATLPVLSYLQFQRIGYFNIDKDSTPEKLVFNRTVGLKDTWGKINK